MYFQVLHAIDKFDLFCGIGIKVGLILEANFVQISFGSDYTINRPGFSMKFVALEGR